MVELPGVVPLDHERGRRPGSGRRRRSVRDGLGRPLRIPLPPVLHQPVLVLRRADRDRRTRIAEHPQRVLTVRQTLEHRRELQLRQPRIVELLPPAGSRHRRPRPTPQRERRDRRLRPVVLAPVDEDLPRASLLRHLAHHETRLVRGQGPRELVRHERHLLGTLPTVQRRVQVDPLAPTREWNRIQPHVHQHRPSQARDPRALGEGHPLARIEVEDETVGRTALAGSAEPPLRHVQLERTQLRQPRECREIVDDRVLVRVIAVLEGEPLDPVGSRSTQVLLEEPDSGDAAVPTPCTQRFRVTGRSATCGRRCSATAA